MECLPQIVWGCRFCFAWFSGWRTVKWSIMTIVFNVHWIKTDVFVESQTKFATTSSQACMCPQGILVTHAFRIYMKMHSSCVWSVLLQLWKIYFWFSLICHVTPKDVPMKRWSSFFQATLRHFLDLFQSAVSEGFPSKSSDSVKWSDDVSWCVLRSLPGGQRKHWFQFSGSHWLFGRNRFRARRSSMMRQCLRIWERQTPQIRNWVNERLSKFCANDLFRCRTNRSVRSCRFWGISAPTPQAFQNISK